MLFYCGAIQAARLFLGKDNYTSLQQQRLLRPETPIGWLLVAPGMSGMIALSDDLGTTLYRTAWIRTPLRATRDWTNKQLAGWRPYQKMRWGIIPSDALAKTGPAGIPPYFVPDLKFIDFWGLTNATIARNPVTGRRWRFGHARQPPPGYLRARGVNFEVYPAAASAEEAMGDGLYAVQVGPALWLPFDAPSREWVAARFAQFKSTLENARLLMRGPLDVYLESWGNRLLYVKDRLWRLGAGDLSARRTGECGGPRSGPPAIRIREPGFRTLPRPVVAGDRALCSGEVVARLPHCCYPYGPVQSRKREATVAEGVPVRWGLGRQPAGQILV